MIKTNMSAAPRTPAEQLLTLQSDISFLEQVIADRDSEISKLRTQSTDRFHKMQGVSFGGIPCAQIWADFVLWEAILNENPQLKGIVEIGTWEGGFSGWLQAQAQLRQMTFWTFDSIMPERFKERYLLGFQKLDVFAYPETVVELIKYGPVILFCDGGNKPREVATFGPQLSDGSLLIVHDWGTEMQPADAPDGLEEIYGDFCDELGSMSRVFRRADQT